MRPIELSKNVHLPFSDLSALGMAASVGASLGGGQSAIRTRTASKPKPGACLAAPMHDAVVAVDLPVSVKLTSSMPMPKADGHPGVCLSAAMKAVNLSVCDV